MMRKLIVAAAVTCALLFVASSAIAHDPKGPKPDKKALEVATACVAGGMNAGLGTTFTAEQLADYCIEVAQRVVQADYDAAP